MLFLDHLRLAWQASNKPIDDFCLTFTHQHVRVSDASQQCAHAAFTLLQEEAGEDVAKAWLNDLKSRDESIVATFEKGKTLQRELEPYLQTTRSNWGGKSAYDLLDSTYYPQPLSKDIIVRFADISSQITFPRASAAALHAIKERVASSFSHAERIMPRDLDHILFIAQQPPLSPTPPPLDGSLSKQDDFVNYNLRKRKPQGKPVSGMKIIKRKKYNPKKTKSDAAPPQDQDENSTPPSPEQGRRAEPPLPEDDSLLALSCISCSPSWDSDATQPKSPTLRNSPNPAPASASLPEDDATRRLPFGLDRIPEQGDDTFAVSGARSTMGDESGLTMELASPQFRLPLITKSHVAVEVTRNHENQEAAESMSELSFTSSPQAKRPNTPPSHQPSSPQFPHPDASQREQPDATQTQPTLPSIAQNVEHGVPCQDMNATSNPSSGTLDAEVRQKSVQELSDPLNATHTSSTMTSARSASSLESILKGEMLKDDVLMGVIETLDLGACYVVDPCNVTDSFTSEAPDRQKQRFQQSPITPLIIHNKQHKHWSLAVYRPRLLALHYYDSVQAPQLENAALGACMASLKWFGQDNACIRWKRMVRSNSDLP